MRSRIDDSKATCSRLNNVYTDFISRYDLHGNKNTTDFHVSSLQTFAKRCLERERIRTYVRTYMLFHKTVQFYNYFIPYTWKRIRIYVRRRSDNKVNMFKKNRPPLIHLYEFYRDVQTSNHRVGCPCVTQELTNRPSTRACRTRRSFVIDGRTYVYRQTERPTDRPTLQSDDNRILRRRVFPTRIGRGEVYGTRGKPLKEKHN